MTEYNSLDSVSEIKFLQLRASTMVGTTSHPTHLFEEVFDNALDESMSGNATKIDVVIKNDICKVTDNGRGMPVGTDENGVPYVVKACTKMYTSGKYNLDVKAYDTPIGLNGIGLTAVAALSDFLVVRTYRDGNCYEYSFAADFDKGLVNHKILPVKKAEGKGTIFCFKPSKKIYRSTKFDAEYIKERIKLCRMLTNVDITLKVDDEVIPIEADERKLLEVFFDEAAGNDMYKASCVNGAETMDIWFYYDYVRNEPRFKGAVNLLPVHSGTHITLVKNLIPEVLNNFFPKNHKLTKTDMLVGLRAFVAVKIKEKEFDGQTKGKLTTDIKQLEKSFSTSMKMNLGKVFHEEMDLQSLYDRFVSYKASLEVKQVAKKIKRRKFTSNLFDCAKYDNSTLFLVEGESAAGSLIKCRDKNKHAIYTLTGKSMPNVETNTANKILGNKTVSDLFNVLGKDLNMEPIDDTSKVRYDYICITTDPDVDGYHISMMMLMFFNKFFPKLIDEGRIVLSQIPLYGYYDKKKFVGVYDLEEAKKMLAKGKNLMRHKGLGEFDPDELEVILFKDAKYTVVTKQNIEDLKEN